VIYGAGAVGGFLGARLASISEHPPSVTLVARPRVVQAVDARGLVVREFGKESTSHPRIAESSSSLPPQDLVLLTIRTYDVAESIEDVLALLGERGVLIAFQNGVGTEEDLAEALGRDRVIAGTLTVSAGMEQPGVVTRYSKGGGVALAPMNGRSVPPWIKDLFESTGLPVMTVDDYRSLRWSKLLLNMLTGAISAILDIDIDTLVSNPRLFRLEQLAFREALAVTDQAGIRVIKLPGYPVPLARLTMRLPRALAQRMLGRRIAAARGGRSSAMRAEMARNRSEVEAYNGAIARAGARTGVATPVNQALTDLTMALVANPSERETYRGKPEKLLTYLRERGVAS
jgi:2-dehydropantoate 2-reductase